MWQPPCPRGSNEREASGGKAQKIGQPSWIPCQGEGEAPPGVQAKGAVRDPGKRPR